MTKQYSDFSIALAQLYSVWHSVDLFCCISPLTNQYPYFCERQDSVPAVTATTITSVLQVVTFEWVVVRPVPPICLISNPKYSNVSVVLKYIFTTTTNTALARRDQPPMAKPS